MKKYLLFKRGLDFIFSSLLLIITLPLLIFIAALIRLESNGPVFFKQRRLGLNGEVFLIYKFRSMVVNAEKMGSGVYSFKGDSRVTKVGAFIRKTSIDELPQLINILKGEMSIIGPRPTLEFHPWPLEGYSLEQKKRFILRPGVTGLAQINGRKEIPWKDRIVIDNQYIENVSFLLDIKIMLKTIRKVFLMEDNYNTKSTVDNNDGTKNK